MVSKQRASGFLENLSAEGDIKQQFELQPIYKEELKRIICLADSSLSKGSSKCDFCCMLALRWFGPNIEPGEAGKRWIKNEANI